MWKCEVCKRENPEDVRICKCGFDRSIDYAKHRTMVKLNAWDKKKYEKYFVYEEPKKSVTPSVTVQRTIEQVKIPTPAQQPKPTTSNEQSKPMTSNIQSNPKPVQKSEPTATNVQQKTTTVQPKAAIHTDEINSYSKDLKSIIPKTKLDWILLAIGIELLLVFIYQLDPVGYFTGGNFIPVIDISNYSVVKICLFLSISYVWMYIILKNIQYDKKKWQIIIYPIVSMFAVSFFVDTMWSFLSHTMIDFYEYVTIENLLASFFGLQLLLIILAFAEDPAKTVAKKKSRKFPMIPKTYAQRVYLYMGGFLVFFLWIGQDALEEYSEYYMYSVVFEKWKMILISWILLYCLSIWLEDHNGWKTIVSMIFAPAPIAFLTMCIIGQCYDLLCVSFGLSIKIFDITMIIIFFILYISFIILAAFDEEL